MLMVCPNQMPAADCGAEEIGETAYCMQPGDKGHYVARIYLIRHGEARASFGEDPDPGLSDEGLRQAEDAASTLRSVGPLPIVSSPLARTRETAQPFAEAWNTTPAIEPRVAEIPTPNLSLAERAQWLGRAMPGCWGDLSANHVAWRDALVSYILDIDQDTLVVSHFVAINAIVGAAVGNDAMLVFRPANASVTIVENDGGRLLVVQQGRSADSTVN